MFKKLSMIFALIMALALVACGGGPAGGPAGGPEADTRDAGGEEAADAGGEEEAGGEEAAASDEVQLADSLSVYNWSDYIDDQILADYTEQYGVEIIYDTYASNEDLLAKLQAGAEGYDVIFLSLIHI